MSKSKVQSRQGKEKSINTIWETDEQITREKP